MDQQYNLTANNMKTLEFDSIIVGYKMLLGIYKEKSTQHNPTIEDNLELASIRTQLESRHNKILDMIRDYPEYTNIYWI